jgi:hypothetical protein
MRQHDRHIEALQALLLAYKDMRRRLDKVDRDLERFHRKITRLLTKLARSQKGRSK